MNTLELIKAITNSPSQKPLYESTGIKKELDIQDKEFNSFVNEAKCFLLDVEKIQKYYNSHDQKNSIRIGNLASFNSFRLPFMTTLFTFEHPLIIKWSSTKNRKEYEDTKLLGCVIKEQESLVSINEKNHEYNTRIYKAFLIFEEDIPKNGNIPEDVSIIGNQFIYFAFAEPTKKEDEGEFRHIDHYPCQDPENCGFDEQGNVKQKFLERDIPVCIEYYTRDCLIETIIYLVNKIHDTITVPMTKKENKQSFFTKNLKGLSLFNKQKIKIPQSNYILKLDGIKYKYDATDIDYGSGTKHRFKYDVRRHPRIIKGRIVWVTEYQRGKGDYIPKIYTNSQKWFIPYLWVEKLTKYRFFEILFIKVITFIKRWRNK
jgi:hypothetical protein